VKKRNARRGFTLIEVLLVVMILAMLAAFAVPSIIGAGENAKKKMAAAAVGDTGPIATSLNMFKLEIGRFPTTDEGLAALVIKPSTLEGAEGDNWRKFMEKAEMLKDPWNHDYGYKFPGEVNVDGYDLWSNGPDGQQGTADDICNWKRDTR
jgi:general secretion pathway protein G